MSEVVETKEDRYDRLIFNNLIKKIKKRIMKEVVTKIEEMPKWKLTIYLNYKLLGEISSISNYNLNQSIDLIGKNKFKEAIAENIEDTVLQIDITQIGNPVSIQF